MLCHSTNKGVHALIQKERNSFVNKTDRRSSKQILDAEIKKTSVDDYTSRIRQQIARS